MSKESVDVEFVERQNTEDIIGKEILRDEHARLPLPTEIAHLTRDEQDQLEKRLVRKMDMRLMPILIVMSVFLLNNINSEAVSNDLKVLAKHPQPKLNCQCQNRRIAKGSSYDQR